MNMTKEEYTEFVHDLFESMEKLIRSKNSDYSYGDDPFANFRTAEYFGVDPLRGLCVRMQDKWQRVQAYMQRGDLKVAGEGIEDAFKDLIGYSCLALGMLEENNRKEADEPTCCEKNVHFSMSPTKFMRQIPYEDEETGLKIPPEVAKFLDDNGALQKYIDNLNREKVDVEDFNDRVNRRPSSAVIEFFDWDETPEGEDYWDDLDGSLRERLNGYEEETQ